MKSFCCFVAIAVCLGLAGVAHASSIDFAANILDPLTGGVPEAANSFAISFTQCSLLPDAGDFPTDITTAPTPPATAADFGCFEGVNDTAATGGATWTSLDMTFGNNSFLAGQTPSCGGIDSGDSIFLSTTCSYSNQIYTLDFSSGTIAPGVSFLIVEETAGNQFDSNGVSLFGTGTAVAGVVPEPNSALLLASGTAMFGLLLYAERRRLLRQSMNS
jgi:hypothetical protein